jgi:hypothetical protein
MRFVIAFIIVLLCSIQARADIVVAWAGQSLCANMFTDTSVSIAPAPGTYIFNPYTNTWGGMGGVGAPAIEYANMMKAQTGQDVYMFNGCVGGSAMLPSSATPPGSNNFWSTNVAGSPLANLINQVNASGKVPNIFHFNQGQAEYTSSLPNVYGDWITGVTWLYGYVLGQWGLTPAQMPMNVWITGRASYGTSQYINAAQLTAALSITGARLGPAYHDLTYDADGTHLSGWQNVMLGDRAARNDLKAMGVPGFGCAGQPRILGGWMVTNQMIEVITDSPCGLHTYAWAATLTGWSVYDTSWNSIPIASAWLSGSAYGTSVYLLLAYPINPRPYVYYWINQYQSPAAPPFANDTSLGINGNPVAPLSFGFQSPN